MTRQDDLIERGLLIVDENDDDSGGSTSTGTSHGGGRGSGVISGDAPISTQIENLMKLGYTKAEATALLSGKTISTTTTGQKQITEPEPTVVSPDVYKLIEAGYTVREARELMAGEQVEKGKIEKLPGEIIIPLPKQEEKDYMPSLMPELPGGIPWVAPSVVQQEGISSIYPETRTGFAPAPHTTKGYRQADIIISPEEAPMDIKQDYQAWQEGLVKKPTGIIAGLGWWGKEVKWGITKPGGAFGEGRPPPSTEIVSKPGGKYQFRLKAITTPGQQYEDFALERALKPKQLSSFYSAFESKPGEWGGTTFAKGVAKEMVIEPIFRGGYTLSKYLPGTSSTLKERRGEFGESEYLKKVSFETAVDVGTIVVGGKLIRGISKFGGKFKYTPAIAGGLFVGGVGVGTAYTTSTQGAEGGGRFLGKVGFRVARGVGGAKALGAASQAFKTYRLSKELVTFKASQETGKIPTTSERGVDKSGIRRALSTGEYTAETPTREIKIDILHAKTRSLEYTGKTKYRTIGEALGEKTRFGDIDITARITTQWKKTGKTTTTEVSEIVPYDVFKAQISSKVAPELEYIREVDFVTGKPRKFQRVDWHYKTSTVEKIVKFPEVKVEPSGLKVTTPTGKITTYDIAGKLGKRIKVKGGAVGRDFPSEYYEYGTDFKTFKSSGRASKTPIFDTSIKPIKPTVPTDKILGDMSVGATTFGSGQATKLKPPKLTSARRAPGDIGVGVVAVYSKALAGTLPQTPPVQIFQPTTLLKQGGMGDIAPPFESSEIELSFKPIFPTEKRKHEPIRATGRTTITSQFKVSEIFQGRSMGQAPTTGQVPSTVQLGVTGTAIGEKQKQFEIQKQLQEPTPPEPRPTPTPPPPPPIWKTPPSRLFPIKIGGFPGGGSLLGRGRKQPRGKAITKYFPSIVAHEFSITAKKEPKMVKALQIRPIIVKPKKKRKGKRKQKLYVPFKI